MPNRYAISDIHGCIRTFKNLLSHLNFQKEDQLYLLGDFVDRGPDSGGVIDHILSLQADGYQVHCLRGNHEQMYLDSYKQAFNPAYWHNQGPWETLNSFGISHIKDTPRRFIDFMDQLPFYISLEDYFLVHAGLDFQQKDPLENTKAMIWERYWYDHLDRDWLGQRIMVHGHTPSPAPIIKESTLRLKQLPVINIDAGCAHRSPGFGQLCALDMDQRQLHFLPNQEAT